MEMMQNGNDLGTFFVVDDTAKPKNVFGYGIMFAVVMEYECKCQLQIQGVNDLYYQISQDEKKSTSRGRGDHQRQVVSQCIVA